MGREQSGEQGHWEGVWTYMYRLRGQGPARPRPFRNVSAETAEIGEKFRRERRGGSRVTASDSECSDCFLGALGAPRGRGDPWGALYGRARGRFRS